MSEVFSKHPLTTNEIRANCEDIKVLGPRDLKQLVWWRDKLREFLDDVGSDGEQPEDVVEVDTTDEQIKRLQKEEAAEVKRCVFKCKTKIVTGHTKRALSVHKSSFSYRPKCVKLNKRANLRFFHRCEL